MRRTMTGSGRQRHLVTIALVAALSFASFRPLAADPLSPVTGTVKTVTDTVEKTVTGAGRTVEKTVSTTRKTVTTTTEEIGLPSPGTDGTPVDSLGRAIVEPVGTLVTGGRATPSSPAETRSGDGVPQDVTQPHDVYLSSVPDVLPRGTLARIYFEPGEATLDGAAKNRILGFAQSFRQRIGNVDIKGYADRSRGDDAKARDIAMQRALAVQEALLAQGIGAGRLRASAMGNTDEGDALEDRVDIRFDGY